MAELTATAKPAKKSKITWGPLEAVVVTIGIFFAAQFIGAMTALIYPALRGWSFDQATDWLTHDVWGQFWLILSVEAIMLGLLYLFLRNRKATFQTLGVVRPQLRDLGSALGAAAVYFVLLIVAVALADALIPQVDVNQRQQLGFEAVTRGPQLLLVFICLVLLPAFVEEVMCRGFLYLGLKTKLPLIWAAVITSIIFAIPHLQFGSNAPLLWVAALDTFILSGVAIAVREKTQTLWPAIGLHMIKNTVGFIALFHVFGMLIR